MRQGPFSFLAFQLHEQAVGASRIKGSDRVRSSGKKKEVQRQFGENQALYTDVESRPCLDRAVGVDTI